MHPLTALVIARLKEFSREPAAIFWVYVFPLIMVTALGVAFRNKPVERISVAVPSGSQAALVQRALADAERFQVRVAEVTECQRLLRTGKVDLLVLPASGENGLEYRFDPTRPTSLLARNATNDAIQRSLGRTEVVKTSSVEVVEQGGRYIDFLVPGLIGMGLMGGGMWGVGFAIVDLRIRNLLKRYLATPMKRSDFLLAVMISRLLFTIPEIAILLIFSRVFFDVVNQGSYLVVSLIVLIGAFQFAGIGLLVASRAKTLETVSGLMNFVMLPMWIASGIFFSTERFPDFVQPALNMLPLTPLIASLRTVMLEGASLAAVSPELAIMLVWATVTFGLALKWFRWS